MRHYTPMSLLFIFVGALGAQEFTTHPNNLIYSEQAMDKLRLVVDSLNLKYFSCDLKKIHHSKYQTLASIITIPKKYRPEARIDMQKQMNFIISFGVGASNHNIYY